MSWLKRLRQRLGGSLNWRRSLPARVALTTTGLLAAVMLLVAGAAYSITAYLVQNAVDRALVTALPLTASSLDEIVERGRHFGGGMPGSFRVLNPDGSVRLGDVTIPVDETALAAAMRTGLSFSSLVPDAAGDLQLRTEPDWWQVLTPRTGEVRVMYARWRGRGPDQGHGQGAGQGPGQAPLQEQLMMLELVSPVGVVGEVLPALLLRIMVLAAVGTVVCGVITWRMSRQTYAPLRAVIAIADSINTETLSRRIPGEWRDDTLDHLCGVLNAMIGRLEEAFETQGRFVAAAAHELRGPLSAMRTNLEVKLRRVRSAEEYRDALGVALAETERLTALSEHLLILARYERGVGLAMQADLPLAPLLRRAADEVQKSTGGEVLVEVPADLTLEGDPIALERMVANLARNAVEAGGAPVRVAARPDGAGVAIAVSDQGRGIPPEAIPKLFEPFFRVDPARSREGGTGLGLAIVKTVVDAHAGRIDVESAPGHGTTFRVWLPGEQKSW
jgi:signal transduction histidine kinase